MRRVIYQLGNVECAMTPSKQSILDSWEAKSQHNLRVLTNSEDNLLATADRRILALIDLVRKKDNALKYYKDHGAINWQTKIPAIQALELTEQLK